MIAALALAGIYLLSLPKSGEDSITSTSGTSKEEVYSPKTALESSSSTTNIMSKNKEEADRNFEELNDKGFKTTDERTTEEYVGT